MPERLLTNHEYDEHRRDPLSPVSYSSFSLSDYIIGNVIDRQFRRR